MSAIPRLSVVVPIYNEEDNVGNLISAIELALYEPLPDTEVILVDDGSADRSLERARAAAAACRLPVRIVELHRNFGQTAAMQAGIDLARGEFIATMDGDLQNDPADIPRMLQRVVDEELDLLSGWRKARQDDLIRTLPSRLANALIGRVTGVRLNDYGCSLKIYRGSVIRQVRLFGQMHRFIPAWVASVTAPTRIAEEVVHHRARVAGQSKYGISRSLLVLLDLLTMLYFLRFRARPGHFFGSIGIVVGVVGMLMLALLGFDKFVLGQDIGDRPMLMIAALCVLSAVQLLTTGVVAEVLTRTYHESARSPAYVIRSQSLSGGPEHRTAAAGAVSAGAGSATTAPATTAPETPPVDGAADRSAGAGGS